MRKQLLRIGVVLGALTLSGSPAWAHPSTRFHVHAEEIAGLLVGSLVIVGLIVLWRADGGGRGKL